MQKIRREGSHLAPYEPIVRIFFVRITYVRTCWAQFEKNDVTWRMTYENTGALRLGTFPFLQDELDSLCVHSHLRHSVFYIGTLLRSHAVDPQSLLRMHSHTRIRRVRSSSSSSSLLRTKTSDAFGTAQLLGVSTSQHEQ